MSCTYDHDNSGTDESFESPRFLNHDDLEDNQPVVGLMTESDSPIPDIHKGLDGIHDMPVSSSA